MTKKEKRTKRQDPLMRHDFVVSVTLSILARSHASACDDLRNDILLDAKECRDLVLAAWDAKKVTHKKQKKEDGDEMVCYEEGEELT